MRAVNPDIATLGLSVDSSALDRAIAELRQLPAATRIVAGSAAKEASALANMLDQPPDDIWPI